MFVSKLSLRKLLRLFKGFVFNIQLNSVQTAHATSTNKLKHVVNCLFYDFNRLISTFRIEIIVCLNDASAGANNFTSIHSFSRALLSQGLHLAFHWEASLLLGNERKKTFQQTQPKKKREGNKKKSFVEKENTITSAKATSTRKSIFHYFELLFFSTNNDNLIERANRKGTGRGKKEESWT